MPISKQRLTERGFNQSLLLAKLLSKQLRIPVWQPVQRLNERSQKDYLDSKDLKILNSNCSITQEKRRYRRVLIIDGDHNRKFNFRFKSGAKTARVHIYLCKLPSCCLIYIILKLLNCR